MNYTNIFNTFIVEPLIEIITDEFKGIPAELSSHTGNQSFLINFKTDEMDDMRTHGQIRDYEVDIEYQYKKSTLDRKVMQHLSEIGERMKRLINNNRHFFVKGTWVSETGTWGATTTLWSANRDTYCWHSGRIESINYEQEDENRSVKMVFQCLREEVI